MRVGDQNVNVADLGLATTIAAGENHVRSGFNALELNADKLENRFGVRPGHPAEAKGA